MTRLLHLRHILEDTDAKRQYWPSLLMPSLVLLWAYKYLSDTSTTRQPVAHSVDHRGESDCVYSTEARFNVIIWQAARNVDVEK